MSGMTGSRIKNQLEELVNSFIMDNNPQALDDDLPDLFDDGDRRQEAIDDLIKYIESNREFL